MNPAQAEAIQDAFEHPQHRRELPLSDCECERENVFCGDALRVQIRIDSGAVVDAAFSGRGCVLSQASAELLLAHAIGQTVNEVLAMSGPSVLERFDLAKIAPARRKCVLLALDALQCALAPKTESE